MYYILSLSLSLSRPVCVCARMLAMIVELIKY